MTTETGRRVAVAVAVVTTFAIAFVAARWLPPAPCGTLLDTLLPCDPVTGLHAILERDLETLHELQEAYRDEHYAYAPRYELLGFAPSPGVVVTATGDVGQGWSATLTHTALGGTAACAVYWGERIAKPLLMGESEVEAGEIFCTP